MDDCRRCAKPARLTQADIKRAVDIAERAANGWVVEYTDFYTPPLVADVLANTKRLAGIEVGIQSFLSVDTPIVALT